MPKNWDFKMHGRCSGHLWISRRGKPVQPLPPRQQPGRHGQQDTIALEDPGDQLTPAGASAFKQHVGGPSNPAGDPEPSAPKCPNANLGEQHSGARASQRQEFHGIGVHKDHAYLPPPGSPGCIICWFHDRECQGEHLMSLNKDSAQEMHDLYNWGRPRKGAAVVGG